MRPAHYGEQAVSWGGDMLICRHNAFFGSRHARPLPKNAFQLCMAPGSAQAAPDRTPAPKGGGAYCRRAISLRRRESIRFSRREM